MNVGVSFFNSAEENCEPSTSPSLPNPQFHQRIRVSPCTICLKKTKEKKALRGAQERIHLCLSPTSQLQLLETVATEAAAAQRSDTRCPCAGAEQFVCTSDLRTPHLSTPFPHLLPLPCPRTPGRLRAVELPTRLVWRCNMTGAPLASHYLFQMCGAICQ